jgi:hypothetical protein
MSEPSSLGSRTPLAFFDPESVCLRMSQGTFLKEEPELLQRLPDWGTTADGVLYEHQTPALLIGVRAGSALLATPTAWLGRRPSGAIGDPERWRDPERSNELSDQMAALLPTPVVNDMGAGKSVEAWDNWTDEMKARHGNSNGHGKSLSIEVQRLLPTPTAQDGANNAGPSQWNRNSDPLNVVAAKLGGETMPTPSPDGNEPSDGPHLTQQTTEDSDPDSSSG